ncbi:MAG: peptidoglycan DD-metalloendopeptidase family protein [Burkholderiaceae bacterium]|nr:peptidoglycan DD-metalloendopeptidase family protein [Burkholderiaceae bacterium]
MHHSRRFKQVAIATAVVSALGAVTAFGVAPLTQSEIPEIERVVEPLAITIAAPDPIESFAQTETIRRGDTLAQLLSRLGATDPGFLRFASADPVARKVLQLRAGRSAQAEVDAAGRVLRYAYRLGSIDDVADSQPARIEIRRDGDAFTASETPIPLERSVEVRSVEIRSSLFAATDEAGIPELVAIKIADIFGGDIDFQRDLRKGDRLRVVYETIREADSLDSAVGSRVLAVEFVNNGKTYDAFWFGNEGRGEYYSFEGRSLKKAFLRNPLEFSRVTSGFSNSRLHPIHRDWRAHRGVDFGAPTGTKVRATADGVVEFVGRQRGYGNVVIVQHRNQHSTLYAHLNEFATGLRKGARVSQGDTIAYVGRTGWATGPHLHYEIAIRGEQVNPMTAALPEGRTLDGAERKRLVRAVADVREQMLRFDTLLVARFQ